MLKYRLTDITKPTKLYLLYITVYMHIVFHRRKKSFLIIEMKLCHCITLQKKTLRKQYYSIQLLLLVVEHISASIKA